jgi:hypothetical protein
MGSLMLITKGMERVVCPLGNAMMLIGRDPKSGIHLQADEVSMNHASIVFQNGQYVIRDNGSRNGTLVNGEKITNRVLAHNDQIVFGPYSFLVDLQSHFDVKSAPGFSNTRMARGGQSYRSSAKLPTPHGAPKSQTVHVMMSGKVSNPNLQESRKATWNRAIIFGFAATSILAILAGSAWYEESQINTSHFKKQQQAEAKISELSSSLAKGAENILSLQHKLEAADKKLEQANAEVEKLQSSIISPPASTSVEAQPTPESTSVDAQPTSVPIPAPTDHATSAAMLGIEPFQPDPLLTFPSEVTLQSEITVPVILEPNVKATRKVPAGRSFPVKSASQDSVEIDFLGHKVSLRKDQTDFTDKLDAANAQINQVNTRNYNDWKIRVEAALQAHKEEDAVRASLAAEMKPISLIVETSFPEGVLGRTPNGSMAYLTGINSSLASGERWKGDAYPMGLYISSPNSNLKYRHYTANFEEFKQFKKNGSPEISATRSEAQSHQKARDKLSFSKLEELYNLANPLGTIDSLKRILADKNSNIQLELERYCRDESKKWEDVAAIAKDLIRAGGKNSTEGLWLKQVVLCSEMCVPERVDIFMEHLKILDKNWLDIKIKHLISEKD